MALIAWFLVGTASSAIAQSVPPTIVRHPVSQSKSLGDTVRLSTVFTSATPVTLQWQKDGQPLTGATNALLVLTGLKVSDAGDYAVRLSNELGTVTSDSARVDVDTTFRVISDTPISRDVGWSMAWGDYDGDGWIDLLCSGQTTPFLYHNEGNGQFVKIGRTNALTVRTYSNDNGFAAFVDFDNDGRRDVHIGTGFNPTDEADYLYRNLGGGSFVLVTNAMTRRVQSSMSATWGDYNGDGRLDVFLGNVTGSLAERANELWFNQPDGSFQQAAAEDFPGLNRRNFGSAAVDYDLDGDVDVLVTTNPGGVVIAYDNRGNGTFDTVALGGNGSYIGSVGVADYDNDGLPDLYVAYGANFGLLLHNQGGGRFIKAEPQPLLEEPGRSTCGTWGDYDNDGWLDLFVPRTTFYTAQGSNDDSLWRNQGDGTFERIPAGSLGSDGLNTTAAAWGDYDNDGFLDLVMADLARNRLYRNSGNSNAWLLLRLVGTVSNRDAIGARVRLKAAIGAPEDRRRTQYRQVGFTAGYAAQNDSRVHFGLADATQADEVEIRWPSGKVTTLRNVVARQILTITEPDDRLRLQVRAVAAGGEIRQWELSVTGPPGTAVAIDASADLGAWTEAARLTLSPDGTGVLLLEGASDTSSFFRTRGL
ncbi:MAG: VCBS repeat-containing protein [Verrucomicrobiales bacterium]|nr:VCBS repeat-containing protein [Verrucomicrobiales bacterium]